MNVDTEYTRDSKDYSSRLNEETLLLSGGAICLPLSPRIILKYEDW